jgi:hypothetical protein
MPTEFYVVLRVKCTLFLSDLNTNWNKQRLVEVSSIQFF